MEKLTFKPRGILKVAIYSVDYCIANNQDVIDRLNEGYGLFASVLIMDDGKPFVNITLISREHLGSSCDN